ncbi:NfeD family protein [Trinickia diaoshuihuensis]|jgi:membrane protein implicated in regulation of membrane protease activity|uniref:NfeD family protein n=1 Tax=Trinickia diaoshuihuensis TaxID=2292265 RepID=UPI000E23A549|nr:NfeD family protein [Trinickia diaoshuihuensis]
MAPNDFLWWIGAGALIVAELLTGTFYLLMIALGFLAGAVAKLYGASLAAQCVWAAVIALAAVMLLRRSRFGRRQRRDASSNPDVVLDVGAPVQVSAWRDGRARVPYRGAEWDVELAPGEREDAGVYEIAAVRANRLVLVARGRAPHHPVSTTKE